MASLLRRFSQFGGIFKISIAALLVVTAFGIFDFILPYFTEGITENMFLIGLTVSLVYFASFFAEVPIGLLVDKFGRKSVMVASLLLLAGMGGVYFFVTDLILLMILELVFGVIAVAFWVPSSVLVRDYSPKGRFGKSEGIYFTFMQGGWIIGPVIAGFIADGIEPRYAFLAFSTFALAGVVYSHFALTKRSPRRKAALLKDTAKLFNLMRSFKGYVRMHKHSLPLYLTSVFANIWIGIEWVFIQIASSRVFGLNEIAVGFIFAAMMGVEGSLYFTAGHIMDKVGKKFVLLAGFLLLFTSTYYAFLSTNVYMFLFFILIGAGALAWIVPGTEAIATELIPIQKRGEMTGVFDSSKDFGLMIGPLAGGAIAQLLNAPMAPFLLVAVVSAVGVFVSIMFWKR